MGGIALEEPLEDLEGLAPAIGVAMDLRERDVRALDLWMLLDQRGQHAHGVLILASPDEDQRQVVRGFAVVGFAGERLPEVRLRLREVPVAREDQAEIVERLWEV